jgi:hypothetical protein
VYGLHYSLSEDVDANDLCDSLHVPPSSARRNLFFLVFGPLSGGRLQASNWSLLFIYPTLEDRKFWLWEECIVLAVFDYVQIFSSSPRKLVVSRKGHGTMVLEQPLQERDELVLAQRELRVLDVSIHWLIPATLKALASFPPLEQLTIVWSNTADVPLEDPVFRDNKDGRC